MDEEARRLQALEPRWRRVGWRQIGDVAEGLIVRVLAARAANDNEPGRH